MTNILKVVAISGSLRKASTNSGLLRACIDIKHPRISINIADISKIPLFNEDLESKTPQAVLKLKQQVKNSHAILYGMTENNYSVSAALKNAHDWLSRGQTPLKEKCVGMISSGGGLGGKRAQNNYRAIGQYSKMKIMSDPQVCIPRFAGKYFDENGNVIDQEIKNKLKTFLDHFEKWIRTNSQ